MLSFANRTATSGAEIPACAGHYTRQIPDLSEAQEQELQRWVRRAKTAQALVLRARIVLQTAAGKSDMEVAGQLGTTRATVGKWRRRFLRDGCDGLLDEPRPGAPRTIGDDDVERVVVQTLETIPAGATHWSTRSMAKACGLSAATVSRIWRAFGLKPHRCETFKLSRDPLFIEKVRDVVGLYLHRPSARWCCAWTRSRRFKRWSAASRYCRCVQASQSGAAGTEPPRCLRPWTRQMLPAPPPQVPRRHRQSRPGGPRHSSGAGQLRHAQDGDDSRYRASPAASWINQVERWFAAITERQICGTHRSTEELEQAIDEYLTVHNENAVHLDQER